MILPSDPWLQLGDDQRSTPSPKITSSFEAENVGTTGNKVDLSISLLSLLGSLVIIVPYIFNKTSRKLRHALILGLASSDLVSCLAIIISTCLLLQNVNLVDSHVALCSFLGFLLTSAIFTQHLWNLAIATVTYMLLIHPLSNFTLTVERRLIWLWPLFWAVSLVIHAFVWVFTGFGFSGGYCTFQPQSRFASIFQFVPRAIVFVVIIVLYTHLFFFLRRTDLFKAASHIPRSQASNNPSKALSAKNQADAIDPSLDNPNTVESSIVGQVTAPTSTVEAASSSLANQKSLRSNRFLSLFRNTYSKGYSNRYEGNDIDVSQTDASQTRSIAKMMDKNNGWEMTNFRSLERNSTKPTRTTNQNDETDTISVLGDSKTDHLSILLPTTSDSEKAIDEPGPIAEQSSQDTSGTTLASIEKLVSVATSQTSPGENSHVQRPIVVRSRSASDPLRMLQAINTLKSPTFQPLASIVDDRFDLNCGARISSQSSATPLLNDVHYRSEHHDLLAQNPLVDSMRGTKQPSRDFKEAPSNQATYGFSEGRLKSSHAYTIGGKNGKRMVARRASLGDSISSGGGDEDDYHFTPMQPRKDAADFDMVTAPREHLKHRNAPKIWAKITDILAMNREEMEMENATQGKRGAREAVNGSVATAMPTEEEFQQALAEGWNWGMDVGSVGFNGAECESGYARQRPESAAPRAQTTSTNGCKAVSSTNGTCSSSSDENGVESLGSTLNRQASLLMLLYPAAYCLLFSVSIIRLIDDLVNPAQAQQHPQDALHAISRWFILAQGAFDALIFQIIERHFRKRMRRRRKKALGEKVEDLCSTKMLKAVIRFTSAVGNAFLSVLSKSGKTNT